LRLSGPWPNRTPPRSTFPLLYEYRVAPFDSLTQLRKKEFRRQLREWVDTAHAAVSAEAERAQELEQRVSMGCLLGDAYLAKVLKYESHIWKPLQKTIHELERLQQRRITGRRLALLAVDVDLNVETGNPKGGSMKLKDYLGIKD